MYYYIWMCIFAVVAFQFTVGSSEDALQISSPADELKLNNFTSNCRNEGLFCKSCTELMVCIPTEYGWTEQLIETCSGPESCHDNQCSSERNVLCDGTAGIPFKCHIPGAYPDPFDCQAYHFCVLTTEKQGEDIVEVIKDFKHECPDDGSKSYRYDAKSTYCKYKVNHKCPKLPVPVCKYAGDSAPLIENDSIYYVCELINNVLYPNLYSCPHGRSFDNYTKRCDNDDTTYEPTTADPTITQTEGSTGTYSWIETTTRYPETTTRYPETTTRYPETTTRYPETTTRYPETTTRYPETTTRYPETTTRYPETTTRYPETTTRYPETTTRYPETTTRYPETTTRYPETTTRYPETTTRYPETTTRYPETTSRYPETTTRYPETTTRYPETTTRYPESTTTYHNPRK